MPAAPAPHTARLSWPELHPLRKEIATQLAAVLNDPEQLAALKLTGAAAREFSHNAALFSAPAAPAHEVYTGVLYQALDFARLSDLGRRNARTALAITSALWGLVRLEDQIPAYRLTAGMKLPGIGGITPAWRTALTPVLDPIAAQQIIIDCRSGPYVSMWKPRGADRENWLPVRVFNESRGKRSVVSHNAKYTRGTLARQLLERAKNPILRQDEVTEIAATLPHTKVEITPNLKAGTSQPLRTLDLIVTAPIGD